MTPEARSVRPRSPRAAAIAAALSLLAGTPFAQPVDVPRIEAPVGAGNVGVAPSAGASVLAPSLSAVTAPSFSPFAAPMPVAAPVLAPALAAPALPALAAAPAASAGGFGKRVQPSGAPAAEPARGEPGDAESNDGDGNWARSSALFDLAAEHGADAVPTALQAGLPGNHVGKLLGRLRLAGQSGRPGPGAIPGMERVEWAGATGRGQSGETTSLRIAGKPWYLKRLGPSPDPGIQALPVETRASNEAGFAAVLRADPQLSRSFAVSPQVSVFSDGRSVFVLTEGLSSIGNGESQRQELSPVQRADAAIVQLVLGLGDMHGGDVLPLGGGRFGLIDFEKLSRAPLEKATSREIDEQVMLKNFPLVDRLSANDPALYQRRFAEWKDDYDNGGRARMDRALAGQGWSRAQREVYLAAVDQNAATYLERLQPYLDYGNEWHQRILKARADAARAPPEKKSRGLFGWGK